VFADIRNLSNETFVEQVWADINSLFLGDGSAPYKLPDRKLQELHATVCKARDAIQKLEQELKLNPAQSLQLDNSKKKGILLNAFSGYLQAQGSIVLGYDEDIINRKHPNGSTIPTIGWPL
jgi:hypothetical protein